MFILDRGSRIRIFSILDPGSWIKIFCILDPWSRIRIFSLPDPGSRMRIKEFRYFNQKKWFLSYQKYDPCFGSRIRIPDLDPNFLPIPDPDPGSQIPNPWIKKVPDPWSRIRLCNIGDFRFAQAAGGSVGYWLSTGAAVLTTHSMDQLSEAFMCNKRILRIFYLHIISLIFTLFKLWCPAHLFPNTPRKWHCSALVNALRRSRTGTMTIDQVAQSTFFSAAGPSGPVWLLKFSRAKWPSPTSS